MLTYKGEKGEYILHNIKREITKTFPWQKEDLGCLYWDKVLYSVQYEGQNKEKTPTQILQC